MNFIDKLHAVVPPHVVMGQLLGCSIAPKGETIVPCYNAAGHTHGSQNPNLRVNGATGLYFCHCGEKGDAVVLVQKLGLAEQRTAIPYIEGLFRLEGPNGHSMNGHVEPRTFPYYRETAEKLGWSFTEESGVLWAKGPIYDHTGERTGWKHRGPRDDAGKVRARVEGGPGMIGDVPDIETAPPGSLVFVVCGEPDYWALHHYAEREGIVVRAVSHSNGEASSFDIQPTEKNPNHRPIHQLLANLRVVYVGDMDVRGKEYAKARVTEFPRATSTQNLELHFRPDQIAAGCKDLRDWFERCGGTVRELLRLADPKKAADSWDMADMMAEEDDPPPDEFVSRLFVRPSFNIVFGPPQAGKSWAVMALCLDAVLGGGNFLGCEDLYIKPLREIRDGKDERVLWVFGSEDTRARVKRRLKTLLKSGPQSEHTIPRGAFVVATPPGGTSIHLKDGWAWLLKKIEEIQPTIVVLDTIASLTGNSLDVNKAEQVIPFISQINSLRSEKNLIIFALHHTRKSSGDGKKSSGVQADAMLGAGAWRGLSEGVLMLDAPDGDTSKVTVLSVKAKDIDRPIPKLFVTLESPGGRFRQLDEDEQPAPREAVQKGGRPPKFSASTILALREKNPSGIPWACEPICTLLDIGKSQWFERREIVFQALSDAGCAVIQGTLKWPSGN